MSEFVFIPLFVAVFFLLTLAIYNNIAVVTKYKLNTDKFEGGLRIVLLSDFHNKSYGKGNVKLIRRISQLQPDVILITGDTVDRRRPRFDVARRFVEDVSAVAQTYLITGNHEHILGREECIDKLNCQDILLDEKYKIFRDWSVLGLSDAEEDEDNDRRRDLLCVFERLDNFKIVAVHRPIRFCDDLDISTYDVDLVLCGHTHGGAFRIPFFGAIFSPDEGFFPKYSKGRFFEKGKTMIVSGGLGNTFLPLRFNNFPEIVVIDINKK